MAIGRLERFVADWYRENVNAMPEKVASNGIQVAVVGSGPAGMSRNFKITRFTVFVFVGIFFLNGE